MSYKAVFWDFGGVITSSPFEAFNRYEAARGIPRDFIRQTNATNPDANAWALLERSDVTAGDFDRLFLAETTRRGHPIPGRDVIGLLYGTVRPAMVEALRRVRDSRICACLTNNFTTSFEDAAHTPDANGRAIAEARSLFHLTLESSKIGVRKPETLFYERACEAAKVAPSEVVFLDDLGVNLKPAAAMGMKTIKVVSAIKALAELEDALGIPLA